MAVQVWTHDETLKFIEIWSEERIQEELEGCRRNKHVFDKIVRELKDAGFSRTVEQCRAKMKKLKAEYKKVVDTHSNTGERRKVWKYYDAMDQILGGRPAISPAVIVDTLDDHNEEVQPADNEYDDETGGSFTEQGPSPVELGSSSVEQSSSADADQSSVEKQSDDCIVVKSEEDLKKKKHGESRSKKRPATKEDRLEKVMSAVVSKVLKGQEESDIRFMGLEEKRMRLEEKMLELEDRRYREEREREERLHREDREFQLRMFTMMAGNSHPMFATPPLSAPSHGVPPPSHQVAYHFPSSFPRSSTPHSSIVDDFELENN